MKFLAWLVFAAALFWCAYEAHLQYDESRVPAGPPAKSHLDATAAWTQIMRDGLPVLGLARTQLDGQGFDDQIDEVWALFPKADEPWCAQVDTLLGIPKQWPYPATVGVEIVEPRGVVTPGRQMIFLRRAFPGTIDVTVELLGEPNSTVATFEVPSAHWKLMPEAAAFVEGCRYRITVREKGQTNVASESLVAVIRPSEGRAYRQQLNWLTQSIADPIIRSYAQASLAMSGGLYCEASRILFKNFGKPQKAQDQAGVSRGLLARLAFLHHRRGSFRSRDDALDGLRGPIKAAK